MQTRVSTEAVAALYAFAQDTLHAFAEDTFEPKTSISPNSGLPDAPNPLVFECESLARLRTKVSSVLDSFVDEISERVCAGALTYPNSGLLNTSHSLINNTFKREGLVDPGAKSSSVLDSFASNFKSACTDTSTHPNTDVSSPFTNKTFKHVGAGASVLPNSEHAGAGTSAHPNTGISIAYNAITNNLFNYLNYLITLV